MQNKNSYSFIGELIGGIVLGFVLGIFISPILHPLVNGDYQELTILAAPFVVGFIVILLIPIFLIFYYLKRQGYKTLVYSAVLCATTLIALTLTNYVPTAGKLGSILNNILGIKF